LGSHPQILQNNLLFYVSNPASKNETMLFIEKRCRTIGLTELVDTNLTLYFLSKLSCGRFGLVAVVLEAST
jgi:hypothetical protein